jgi:hypothetical protein
MEISHKARCERATLYGTDEMNNKGRRSGATGAEPKDDW